MLTLLAKGLQEMGLEADSNRLRLFETYRDELIRWNQRVNLTSIVDPVEMEKRHFLDSLTLLYALPDGTASGAGISIIDVGSGAGFPGIPVKLLLPETRVTLLEATGKKANFLSHIVSLLGLNGVEVLHGRAEDVARLPAYREQYDVAVARAVAALPTLAELCLPFVRVGGQFVALKKGDLETEVGSARKALHALGGGEARLIAVPLEQLSDGRYLVCSNKLCRTPDAYPRHAGAPFKRPL